MVSISAVAKGFADSLAGSWDGQIIDDPLQGARVSFLTVGAGEAQIELVEPAADDSPVTRFAQKGGGLHHLCYEVPVLEEQVARSRVAGAVLVSSPQPAVAFEGRRICWVFTKERLLVEYLEAAAPRTVP